ncbi:hypothetical protein BDZ97DRAFT_973627 [Flammula alnicola]|nr:hypothetical protein BDZ97DRAFT_973627 [Flammula alnicola]
MSSEGSGFQVHSDAPTRISLGWMHRGYLRTFRVCRVHAPFALCGTSLPGYQFGILIPLSARLKLCERSTHVFFRDSGDQRCNPSSYSSLVLGLSLSQPRLYLCLSFWCPRFISAFRARRCSSERQGAPTCSRGWSLVGLRRLRHVPCELICTY